MINPKTTFIMGILTAFAAVVFYMENMYEVPIKTVVRKIDNLVEIEKPKPNFSDDAEQINSSLNKSKLKHVLIISTPYVMNIPYHMIWLNQL